ncbi:MAG TPA: 2-oxo-4-hydroxy-4-carboxy-5-ureidoimidazoline decarboxylase, partial [Rhizobiales bacterium]|nr:2-oxo-4-hydroxy-4-carboxy-5-ureidoimidazoline decarboxylase [Hyphomicrobiales bacterium]
HWQKHHPPGQNAVRPSNMDKKAFVRAFGGVFEHSPWIAERAFDLEKGPAHDSAAGVHSLLCRVFRAAARDEQLGVLRAHPDLAGKLAAARRLTDESAREQASAGLDALSDAERSRFSALNAAYMEKHGFPFIIAVKGLDKAAILEAFESRIKNDRETEFATACKQVERIALLRLREILG